jgi:hypothetical protein
MAWEQGPHFKVSLETAADLRAKQFYLLKLTSVGKVDVCAAVTDVPIGVLQNKPNLGQTAEVVVYGVSKVSGDADLAIGDLIGTSVDGQAAKQTPGTDVTHYVIGRVLADNTAAGGLVSAVVNCACPSRAT